MGHPVLAGGWCWGVVKTHVSEARLFGKLRASYGALGTNSLPWRSASGCLS